MADYSTIKGFTIQSLSSDPPAPQVGQVWYNTTSTTLKGYGAQGTGAWASGNGLVAEHANNAFGLGIQTAAICAGGTQPGPTDLAICETYDGTSWSEGSNILTARCKGVSAGTTTAGLIGGGVVTESSWTVGYGNTEEYNGTSWSEVNNLNTVFANCGFGTMGTQTAAIKAGGTTPATMTTCETYDGTSWTEINPINTGGGNCGAAGTSTAAVLMGRDGSPVPDKSITELYDGTSWTEVSNMNTAREGEAGAGTSTLAIAIGGYGSTSAVEQWNGSAWTTVASLGAAQQYNSSAGTGSLALGMYLQTCEEWTVPDATKTFTAT